MKREECLGERVEKVTHHNNRGMSLQLQLVRLSPTTLWLSHAEINKTTKLSFLLHKLLLLSKKRFKTKMNFQKYTFIKRTPEVTEIEVDWAFPCE